MSEPIRVFISIDVPITNEIKGILKELKDYRGIRASPLSQIHITLSFLGDTDPKKAERLVSSLNESFCEMHPFALDVKGIGTFPEKGDPRIVWMGIGDSPELMGCAETVRDTVERSGLSQDGKRFSPHITIGRCTARTDVSELVTKYDGTVFSSFACTEINVMKSVLTPKGAIHSAIGKIVLK